MDLFTFTVNPFQENTYLMVEDDRAIVVDPGFYTAEEFREFEEVFSEQEAALDAVILTHGHIDHILGIPELYRKYGMPVFMHPADLPFWQEIEMQAMVFGVRASKPGFEPLPIEPAGQWNAGKFHFDVRFTPGHAPGHVVFYAKEYNLLFGGDTVFRDSIGRTDLLMGDPEQLEKSIRTQIYTLPDDARILPGHGPETTVGYEKHHNPYVRE